MQTLRAAALMPHCSMESAVQQPNLQLLKASAWMNASPILAQQGGRRLRNAGPTRAKNVILFVGDGMGVSTVTAARILAGQLEGGDGEENLLSFETFPQLALSKTYNTNQQTPDSAGTMTAMILGVKTLAGVLSVDGSVRRGTALPAWTPACRAS